MAIDIQQLNTDLSAYGNVIFCNENSPISFVVVITNVNESVTVSDIINTHIAAEYPLQTSCTIKNGVYKCERMKNE